MTATLPPSVRLERPRITATLGAIHRAIDKGARGELVETLAIDAARRTGLGRDRVALLRELAGAVGRRVAFLEDAYGGETVQPAERTWELGAGDCDDLAVLVGALAARIGLRTGVATWYAEKAGETVATHVVPVVEDPRTGRTLFVELVEKSTPFGQAPTVPGAGSWGITWAAPWSAAGFLDGLFNFLGANKTASAAKKVAKEGTKQANIAAKATVDAATVNAAAVDREGARRLEATAATLNVVREAFPVLSRIALAAAGARVLVAFFDSRRRAPARRAA